MNQYKLVIFDWDGTLINSVERIVSSMQSAALDCKLPIPTSEEVKNIIGLSLPVAIESLFPGSSKEQSNSVILRYKHQYMIGDNTPSPLFDNAIELLDALKKSDRILAIATGKARQGLQHVLTLTQTEHYFHATICADESESKPNPHMLYSLLSELNILPEQSVMVGDTSHDMKMAQNAGIDRIGVSFGAHSKDILSQCEPIAIVDSLLDLQRLLFNK